MKNEKGFNVVEILVVLVVVGLIGGAGWYVYQYSQRESTKQGASNSEGLDELPVLKEGYRQYQGKYLSLQYPKDWLQQNETEYYTKFVTDDSNKKQEVDEDYLSRWIHFTSPDYKPATELGPSVKAGYWLEVTVLEAQEGESYENTVSSMKEAQEAHGGKYETITIDGNKAVLSNIQSHGTSWSANVYKSGENFLFKLHSLDDKKPEVKELFKTILETVVLK